MLRRNKDKFIYALFNELHLLFVRESEASFDYKEK